MSVRFPDLQYKPLWATASLEATGSSDGFPARPTSDANAVSIGDPRPGGEARELILAEAIRRNGTNSVPEFVRPVLLALDQFAGAVTLLTESEEDAWTVTLEPAQVKTEEVSPLKFTYKSLRVAGFRLVVENDAWVLVAFEAGSPSAVLLPSRWRTGRGESFGDWTQRAVSAFDSYVAPSMMGQQAPLTAETAETSDTDGSARGILEVVGAAFAERLASSDGDRAVYFVE